MYGIWRYAGTPETVIGAHADMTTRLRRRFKIHRHLGREFVATNGCPQGDALSILAENVIVAAWSRYVHHRLIEVGVQAASYSYIDDKSATSRDPEAMCIIAQSTDYFAGRFGVIFNVGKSWVFCTDPKAECGRVAWGDRRRLGQEPAQEPKQEGGRRSCAKRVAKLPILMDGKELLLTASAVAKYRSGVEVGGATSRVVGGLQVAILAPLWRPHSTRIPELALVLAHKGAALDLKRVAAMDIATTIWAGIRISAVIAQRWNELWDRRAEMPLVASAVGVAAEMRRHLAWLRWAATSATGWRMYDGRELDLTTVSKGAVHHAIREGARHARLLDLEARRPEFLHLAESIDRDANCRLIRQAWGDASSPRTGVAVCGM